jgi:hypothetical protein
MCQKKLHLWWNGAEGCCRVQQACNTVRSFLQQQVVPQQSVGLGTAVGTFDQPSLNGYNCTPNSYTCKLLIVHSISPVVLIGAFLQITPNHSPSLQNMCELVAIDNRTLWLQITKLAQVKYNKATKTQLNSSKAEHNWLKTYSGIN